MTLLASQFKEKPPLPHPFHTHVDRRLSFFPCVLLLFLTALIQDTRQQQERAQGRLRVAEEPPPTSLGIVTLAGCRTNCTEPAVTEPLRARWGASYWSPLCETRGDVTEYSVPTAQAANFVRTRGEEAINGPGLQRTTAQAQEEGNLVTQAGQRYSQQRYSQQRYSQQRYSQQDIRNKIFTTSRPACGAPPNSVPLLQNSQSWSGDNPPALTRTYRLIDSPR